MNGTTTSTAAGTTFAAEFRIVPQWAKILALVLFACAQVFIDVWIPTQKNPPPEAALIPLGILVGVVLASYVMLLGYVNRDAGRRSMSRTLWTLLVIFIPNALGFVLYFLLRQPIQQPCPRCGWQTQPGFNYCPHCNQKLHPHCAQCQRPVSLADVYCPYCGYKLDEIHLPTPPSGANRTAG